MYLYEHRIGDGQAQALKDYLIQVVEEQEIKIEENEDSDAELDPHFIKSIKIDSCAINDQNLSKIFEAIVK